MLVFGYTLKKNLSPLCKEPNNLLCFNIMLFSLREGGRRTHAYAILHIDGSGLAQCPFPVLWFLASVASLVRFIIIFIIRRTTAYEIETRAIN